MGYDLCLFAERLVDNGKWHLMEELQEDRRSGSPFVPRSIDVCRNYDLFAILASVRWGDRSEFVFAPPISNDRSLPPDICRELREHRARFRYAMGDGWFTHKELLGYDWSRIVEKRGFVAQEVAHLFEGCPLGFPAHDQRIAVSEWSRDGVEVRWRNTYAGAAGLDQFIATLKPYLLSSDDVRFVFWFTS